MRSPKLPACPSSRPPDSSTPGNGGCSASPGGARGREPSRAPQPRVTAAACAAAPPPKSQHEAEHGQRPCRPDCRPVGAPLPKNPRPITQACCVHASPRCSRLSRRFPLRHQAARSAPALAARGTARHSGGVQADSAGPGRCCRPRAAGVAGRRGQGRARHRLPGHGAFAAALHVGRRQRRLDYGLQRVVDRQRAHGRRARGRPARRARRPRSGARPARPCWCGRCRPPLQVACGQDAIARARESAISGACHTAVRPHATGGHAGPGRGKNAPAVGARRILDKPAAQALAAERVACAPGAALSALARPCPILILPSPYTCASGAALSALVRQPNGTRAALSTLCAPSRRLFKRPRQSARHQTRLSAPLSARAMPGEAGL